jgi:hypothetical protein
MDAVIPLSEKEFPEGPSPWRTRLRHCLSLSGRGPGGGSQERNYLLQLKRRQDEKRTDPYSPSQQFCDSAPIIRKMIFAPQISYLKFAAF